MCISWTIDVGESHVYGGESHYISVLRCMWDALLDLVRYVQFKKREKYPWRKDTFSKNEGLRKGGFMGVFHVFQIVRMVPNCAKRHMYYTFLLVP